MILNNNSVFALVLIFNEQLYDFSITLYTSWESNLLCFQFEFCILVSLTIRQSKGFTCTTIFINWCYTNGTSNRLIRKIEFCLTWVYKKHFWSFCFTCSINHDLFRTSCTCISTKYKVSICQSNSCSFSSIRSLNKSTILINRVFCICRNVDRNITDIRKSVINFSSVFIISDSMKG